MTELEICRNILLSLEIPGPIWEHLLLMCQRCNLKYFHNQPKVIFQRLLSRTSVFSCSLQRQKNSNYLRCYLGVWYPYMPCTHAAFMHRLKLIGSLIETYSSQLGERLSLSFKPIFKAKRQWRALHWNPQVLNIQNSVQPTAALDQSWCLLQSPSTNLWTWTLTQTPDRKLSAWNLPCTVHPCTGMCAPENHCNPTGKWKPRRKINPEMHNDHKSHKGCKIL